MRAFFPATNAATAPLITATITIIIIIIIVIIILIIIVIIIVIMMQDCSQMFFSNSEAKDVFVLEGKKVKFHMNQTFENKILYDLEHAIPMCPK